MMKRIKAATVAALLVSVSVQAQEEDWDNVDVRVEHLRGGLHVLFGRGGNIGVSAGEDGVILVDDQYAPLTDKIRAAIKEISDKPLRYVINTHFHHDHTGGNENLGDAAVIVAHDNVRQRLSKGAFIAAFDTTIQPYASKGLPSVTFNSEMSLHINGDEARIIHAENAHTDGDSLIWFKAADVIHMGDLMFNGMFPFIDVSNGGSIGGILGALDKAIAIAGDDTIIIPGHGKVTDKAGLIAYKRTMRDMAGIIGKMKSDGKSLEDIRAAKPLAAYEQTLAQFYDGWVDQFIGFVYESL